MKWVLPAFLFTLINSAYSHAQEPTLTFYVSDKKVNEFNLKELKTTFKTQTIAFVDPSYKKRKRYEAFDLKAILAAGFGPAWKDTSYTDVVFRAMDGFEAVGQMRKFEENGAYLTFRDLDFPKWEPLERKQALPGPFYVIWMGHEQLIENGYPWPIQLQSIKLVTFDEQYARVIPTGVEKTSEAYKGFEIFKQECFRCHSINQQGGKVGPDLNAPKSVVDYRPVPILKEFIKNPSHYRYTNMPDHLYLSEHDLDDLIAYFKLKSKQPKE